MGGNLRILMVCTAGNVYGAEIMSLHILRAFRDRGHSQLAVTSSWSDGEFSRRLRCLGVPEEQLPLGTLAKPLSIRASWWTLNTVAGLPFLWLGMRRVLALFRPDILLFTAPKQGLLLYPWLERQPSFLIEHSMKEISPANRWLYRVLDRKVAGFIPVSKFMASHLGELGIKPRRTQVIYNCSETATAAISVHKSSSLRKADVPFRIGIAGQVAPHKGHDYLLKAAVLLKERGVQFEVRVFGTGDARYIRDLKHEITAARLDARWCWMGYLSDQQSVYEGMDICVVPSCFDEPFGMVALEASSFGLPVIASRRGGLPEIIEDGVTGWLDDVTQPGKLADRLEWFHDNPDAARRMGLAGRERIFREFTQEKMILDFELLFRRHLAGGVCE